MNDNERNAQTVKEALENFSNHPERIENFIFYLSQHFESWINTYASTPDGIAEELKRFSELEIL